MPLCDESSQIGPHNYKRHSCKCNENRSLLDILVCNSSSQDFMTFLKMAIFISASPTANGSTFGLSRMVAGLPRWLSGKKKMYLPMQEIQETQVPFLGQEDSPKVGNSNPLQYSCLENSTDRWAWQVTVHGVAKNQTWLSNWAHTQRAVGMKREETSTSFFLNVEHMTCDLINLI